MSTEYDEYNMPVEQAYQEVLAEMREQGRLEASIEANAAAYRDEPKPKAAPKTAEPAPAPMTAVERAKEIRRLEDSAKSFLDEGRKERTLHGTVDNAIADDLLESGHRLMNEAAALREQDGTDVLRAGFVADAKAKATAKADKDIAVERKRYAEKAATLYTGEALKESMQRFDDAAAAEKKKLVDADVERRFAEQTRTRIGGFGAPMAEMTPVVPFDLQDDGERTYSKKDFEDLMRMDEKTGWKVLNSGRVQF